MNSFAAASIFCLMVSTSAQAQSLNVGQVVAIKEAAATGSFAARAEWHALSFYLQGVIEGAAGYQQTLAEQGKPLLFCPPRGTQYSLQDFFGVLEKSDAADKTRAASVVIMEAYVRRYPCKG